MDLDGGDPRQLTRSGPDDEPSWSPDGKRIAFQSTRDSHYEIYVINVDGTGLQRLTTSTGYANDEPTWSPDGRRIASVSGRPGKPVGAYTMAADGSDVRYVAPTSIGNAYPAWSPDGSTLALAYANALWVVPSAGGKPKMLTQAVASIQWPSW